MTILVLEDEPMNRDIIRTILRLKGHNVVAATTAKEAIDVCRSHSPIHLLIADVKLPQTSGTLVALEILDACPQISILFISGTPKSWWAAQDLANFASLPPHAVDFLEKPFTPIALEQKIGKLTAAR
jgi:two-component system cell cycle sensor histidine kinase/response regulator CckA